MPIVLHLCWGHEELSCVLHHFKCPKHLHIKAKELFGIILIYTEFSKNANLASLGGDCTLVQKFAVCLHHSGKLCP